jgi:hypothetical protein
MRSVLSRKFHLTFSLCALLAAGLCVLSLAHGQEKGQLDAPPPLKVIPPDERAQLEAEHDNKDRTKLSIELAERRLQRAEQLTNEQQFDGAAAEVGIYQALIENALHYLSALNSNKGKVRDLFKRVELSLRAHGPRIEAMRRVTPAEHAVHLKALLEFTKDARTDALNSFYGSTVIRDQPPDGKKAAVDKQHDAPPKSQDKQP